MSSRKKILIVIPSLGSGGAERVLINILKRIPFERYHIDLCVVMNYGRYFEEIPGPVNLTILLNSVFMARLFTFFYTRFNVSFIYRFLVRRKLPGQYDVAVSFVDSSYTDLIFMLPVVPSKIITWIHASQASYSNYSRFYKGKYKQRVINQRYSRIDNFIFVSNDSMAEFKMLFREYNNMQVIYNVIDTEGIRAKSLEFIPEHNGALNIVALGGLFPVKGYDKLISACEKLLIEGIEFNLKIFGEGPLAANLNRMIIQKGLSSVISLEGFHPNPYPYLRNADLFIMTSISEALPTALCEAMLLGNPVVVTDCSGCREIVSNGRYGMMTGQMVDDIYTGLKKMIADPQLRRRYASLALERSSIFNDNEALYKIYNVLG